VSSTVQARPPRAGAHRRNAPQPRTYRPDIQGLRAIAVLLVVLYHAGVPGLTGGYVGVDVFFVISGFLITRQLDREVERSGRLRFGQFYARRIRRLLPIATVVVVATLVVGRAVLPFSQVLSLMQDAIYAATYSINFHLAGAGVQYQNATAPPSALQHFWSLAVEEQFYVVWPILIATVAFIWRRRARRPMTAFAVAGICGITLYLSATLSATNGPVAYFSLQTRAWELGVGALIALSSGKLARLPQSLARAVGWLGLLAIVGSAIGYDDKTVYPGVAALVPVLGAGAIIACGMHRNPRTVETALLDHAPMQYVGRASYAMYLWHWPMLILLPLWAGHPLPLYERLEVVVLAFWFAVLSHFVEDAGHRMSWSMPRWLTAGAAMSAVMVAVSLTISHTMPSLVGNGQVRYAAALTQANPATVQAEIATSLSITALPRNLTPRLGVAAYDVAGQSCHADLLAISSPECVLGDPTASRTAVLLGDSKAHQWASALSTEAKKYHWRIVEMTKAACPIADLHVWNSDLKRPYRECDAFRAKVRADIATMRPSLIIASQSDTVAASAFTDTEWAQKSAAALVRLAGNYARVVYIGDTPTTVVNTTLCLQQHVGNAKLCAYKRQDAFGSFPLRYLVVQRDVTQAKIGYLAVMNFFCGPFYCPAVVGNMVVHRDWGHITDTYARWLTPMLAPVFEGVHS
jgi:peptidoglycan/LPS O-acetylase OafA/YrhL